MAGVQAFGPQLCWHWDVAGWSCGRHQWGLRKGAEKVQCDAQGPESWLPQQFGFEKVPRFVCFKEIFVKRDWKEHRKAMSLAGNPQDDGRDGWPWYWHGLSWDPFHPSRKACIGRWCALVIGFKGSRIPRSIALVHGIVLLRWKRPRGWTQTQLILLTSCWLSSKRTCLQQTWSMTDNICLGGWHGDF